MNDKPVVGSSNERAALQAILDYAGLPAVIYGIAQSALRTPDETEACNCPEVCKVCGGRAKACAVLGHRPEADRSVKWHVCKANELKAFVQLCAPHGKDWLTCPECAKDAGIGGEQA